MVDEKVELARARFGATAQNYVSSSVHAAGYTLETLVERVAPAAGKVALDIATGGGHVALAMSRRGAKVIASDITGPMLRAARANMMAMDTGMDMAFVGVEAGNLPCVDGGLDIVTCRLAAHHFPDAARFVRECARVVKPGGVVGLVDHIGPGEPGADRYCNAFETVRDPSHQWQYSQGEWEAFFVGVGLRIVYQEVVHQRLDFAWWTAMQHNDPDTVLRLRVMLKQAPEQAAQWLDSQVNDAGSGTFAHHDLILVAVK
jgi:ubiquinone/menaquinone biosynthesis C-methylase UbiE